MCTLFASMDKRSYPSRSCAINVRIASASRSAGEMCDGIPNMLQTTQHAADGAPSQGEWHSPKMPNVLYG
jgi:hypothetical protein